MVRFPLPGFGLLIALLLVAGRSWGQAVPEPLAHVLRHYQPLPRADAGVSVALGKRGTVLLPPQATQQRTGTKDSDRGEIHFEYLLIGYDIGRMAGTHISPYNRGGDRFLGGNPVPFSAYEERTAGPLRATLGLRPNRSGTGTEVVATLQNPGPPLTDAAGSFPANFWAVVQTEAELQQFLAVALSYRPAAKP